jgi:hypothetical protein
VDDESGSFLGRRLATGLGFGVRHRCGHAVRSSADA